MSFQRILPTLRAKSVRVGREILGISCGDVGGKDDMVTWVDVNGPSSRIIHSSETNSFTAVERYGRVEPKTFVAFI
jgi:hypothetical protein